MKNLFKYKYFYFLILSCSIGLLSCSKDLVSKTYYFDTQYFNCSEKEIEKVESYKKEILYKDGLKTFRCQSNECDSIAILNFNYNVDKISEIRIKNIILSYSAKVIFTVSPVEDKFFNPEQENKILAYKKIISRN